MAGRQRGVQDELAELPCGKVVGAIETVQAVRGAKSRRKTGENGGEADSQKRNGHQNFQEADTASRASNGAVDFPAGQGHRSELDDAPISVIPV